MVGAYYTNEKVRLFRKQFIEKYHTDPLFAAYVGSDIHQWITTNFTAFGNELEKYTSTTTLTAPGEGFKFERSCEKCGFENQYISILQFKEGTLKKVDQQ